MAWELAVDEHLEFKRREKSNDAAIKKSKTINVKVRYEEAERQAKMKFPLVATVADCMRQCKVGCSCHLCDVTR